MKKIAVISGTGFYDFFHNDEQVVEDIATPFGNVQIDKLQMNGCWLYHLTRHGRGHLYLPNHINHRAHISALHQIGVDLIISTSVMGVLDSQIPLGKLIFFDDLFFPDNRLPDGSICTVHIKPGEPSRGHYIFSSPFSIQARQFIKEAASLLQIPYTDNKTYAYVNGPRFNSKAECSALRNMGADMISQTAGPEIVLSGELGLAYVLMGFGVDYANGVSQTPTPVEELDKNISESKNIFCRVIVKALEQMNSYEGTLFDNGFNYGFE